MSAFRNVVLEIARPNSIWIFGLQLVAGVLESTPITTPTFLLLSYFLQSKLFPKTVDAPPFVLERSSELPTAVRRNFSQFFNSGMSFVKHLSKSSTSFSSYDLT